jgi:hypothetical protein
MHYFKEEKRTFFFFSKHRVKISFNSDTVFITILHWTIFLDYLSLVESLEYERSIKGLLVTDFNIISCLLIVFIFVIWKVYWRTSHFKETNFHSMKVTSGNEHIICFEYPTKLNPSSKLVIEKWHCLYLVLYLDRLNQSWVKLRFV